MAFLICLFSVYWSPDWWVKSNLKSLDTKSCRVDLIRIPSLILSGYLHCSFHDTFIDLIRIPSVSLVYKWTISRRDLLTRDNELSPCGYINHLFVLYSSATFHDFRHTTGLCNPVLGKLKFQETVYCCFHRLGTYAMASRFFLVTWTSYIVLSYIFETFYCTEDIKYCLQLDAQFSSYRFKLKPKMCKTRSVCSVHCQYLWPACITFENAAGW